MKKHGMSVAVWSVLSVLSLASAGAGDFALPSDVLGKARQLPTPAVPSPVDVTPARTPGRGHPGRPSNPGKPSAPSQPSAGGWAQPNQALTPGVLCTPQDPDFQEYRYPEHIAYCQRNVTDQEKQQVAAEYGINWADRANYEFDHRIPLAIGGSSNIKNIWPQPLAQAKVKDQLETQMFTEMQAGTIKQSAAVSQILAWRGN